MKKLLCLLIITVCLFFLAGCSVNTPEAEQARQAVVEWYRSRQFVDMPIECVKCTWQSGEKYTVKVHFDAKKLYPELKDAGVDVPVYKGKFYVEKDGGIYEVYNSDRDHVYTYSDKTGVISQGRIE